MGAAIVLHADGSTRSDLDADAVRSTLWRTGGQVRADVICSGDRFTATSLTALPAP